MWRYWTESRSNSDQSFSICYWSLNSTAAHNFSKISLLKVHNTTHTYDIICLSETYLNYDTLSYNDNLQTPGCKLIRADHIYRRRVLDYIGNCNPFVSIIIGDFNTRSKNWYSSNKKSYEGKKLKSLTSQCKFKQIIRDPTL